MMPEIDRPSSMTSAGVRLASAIVGRPRRRGALMVMPVVAWLGVFMVAPLATMFLYTFWTAHLDTLTIDRTFTLNNYIQILSNPLYRGVLLDTVVNAAIVVGACVLLGYPMAYWLATRSARTRFVMLMALMVPFWQSLLFRSYAWVLVLGSHGIAMSILRLFGVEQAPDWFLHSRFAVLISLIQIYLPFMAMPIFAVLVRHDWQLVEAAKNLGATSWRAFREITLPISAPGVVTGFLFTFIPVMGAFVTPTLLGGTSDQVIAQVIANQFQNAWNWPLGGALSAILVVLLAISVLASLRLGRPWDIYKGAE